MPLRIGVEAIPGLLPGGQILERDQIGELLAQHRMDPNAWKDRFQAGLHPGGAGSINPQFKQSIREFADQTRGRSRNLQLRWNVRGELRFQYEGPPARCMQGCRQQSHPSERGVEGSPVHPPLFCSFRYAAQRLRWEAAIRFLVASLKGFLLRTPADSLRNLGGRPLRLPRVPASRSIRISVSSIAAFSARNSAIILRMSMALPSFRPPIPRLLLFRGIQPV